MLAIESTVSAEQAIRSMVSAAVDATRTTVDDPSVTDYLQDETSLHRAAESNSLDVATLLIDRGVDIEAKNGTGETAFYVAVISNSLDVASLLIDRGANNDDSIAPVPASGFLIDGFGISELVKIIFIDGLAPVVDSNEYFRIENFRVSNVV